MSAGCLRYVRRMPAEFPADRPPDRRRIVRQISTELSTGCSPDIWRASGDSNWKAGIWDLDLGTMEIRALVWRRVGAAAAAAASKI